MRLVSVVMGTDSKKMRKVESKRILSYGFRFFETVKPIETGKLLHQSKIWMGEEDQVELGVNKAIYVTIPRGKSKELKARFMIQKDLSAPIKQGQVAGKIYFSLAGKDIAEHPLVTLKAVKEAGFFGRLYDSVAQWFSSLFE